GAVGVGLARAWCAGDGRGVSQASVPAPPTGTASPRRPAAAPPARRTAISARVSRSRRKRDTLDELDPSAADAVLDDLVGHGAAAVLDDAQHPGDSVADALAAEDQDRVCGRADIARGDLARQQVLEARLLGGDEEQRRDPGVVVAVGVDEPAVL